MRTCIAAIAAGVVLSSGCTELQVRRAPPGEVEGIPYTLPKKTFVVAVTYELRECTEAGDAAEVKVAKTVAPIVAAIQPDENERFYVPYDSLRHWWKDTSITIQSHNNQTLKEVGSVITDRTGEAITSVVSSALKIAMMGAGLRTTEANRKLGPPKCNPAALKALADLKGLRSKNPLTEFEMARMAELKAELSHKQVVHWSPAKPATLPTPAQQALQPLTLATRIVPEGLVGGDDARWVRGGATLPPDLTTELELTVHGVVMPDTGKLPEGFLLRQGPSAALRVCEAKCPTPRLGDAGAIHTEESRVLDRSVHVIPQMGSYVGMPLRNRLFESQTLAITVADDGAITKMGLTSNAVAVEALKSVGTQLDAVAKAKEARDKADAAAGTTAQNAKKDHANQVAQENTAIAECLKAQKALRDAGGIVTGTCQ